MCNYRSRTDHSKGPLLAPSDKHDLTISQRDLDHDIGLSPTMTRHEAEVEVEEEANDRAPLYPGDDPRPTSRKELAGWYCYGWAAEVFTVCAMGMSSTPFRFLHW